MTDINNVTLIGRLTRDLGENDFAYSNSGTARANVSIAVNRAKKQGDEWVDEVSFFDVVIWGKTAENLKPYLTKGKQICVSGHLKQDRWEKDGQRHSRISVVADMVHLCGGKSDGSGNYQNGGAGGNQSFKPASNANNAAMGASGEEFQEDIPF